MTLPAEPQPERAGPDRGVPKGTGVSVDETAKRAGRQTGARPHDTTATATIADTPDQSPPVSLTAGADYDGTAGTVAWLAGYPYPNTAAAMTTWNSLSDPHAMSAALNSVYTSPTITSLARYTPSGPVPVPVPPLFIPGTPANEDFVQSAIRAGEAILDAIGNILHNDVHLSVAGAAGPSILSGWSLGGPAGR